MGKTYESVDDRLEQWMCKQPVFFVGTAPLASDGHVNVSPKGGAGSFIVLGPRQVSYLDLTGSGAETIAHLRENRRLTLMFCAFEGPPRIVRLYGRGRVLQDGAEFDELRLRFADRRGVRSIVVADLDRISDSCGYAVPHMELIEHRSNLDRWIDQKGEAGLTAYRADRNALSIDGLPALS